MSTLAGYLTFCLSCISNHEGVYDMKWEERTENFPPTGGLQEIKHLGLIIK